MVISQGAIMDDLESAAPDPTTSLVQIDDEHAVVFGVVPEGVECIPFDFLGEFERDSLTEAFRQAAGWGNLAAQAWQAQATAQGVVRLAPQTLAALKTAQPITDGAWNLGTLTGHGGKFATSVRWAPATGATAAGVAASAGMAVTMIAIQMQLAKVESLVVRSLEQTTRVLEAVEQEFQSNVLASSQILATELAHARSLGAVTDGIWYTVNSHETEVLSGWNLYQSRVTEHASDLRSKKGHKERRELLRSRAGRIVSDCQLLMVAHQSWIRWRQLRVGHLLDTGDLRDRVLAARIVDETRTLHAETLETTAELLGQVEREVAILRLRGERTLPFGGRQRASVEVQRCAEQMQEALAALSGKGAKRSTEPEEGLVLALQEVDPDQAVMAARIAIGRGEALKGIAEVRGVASGLRGRRALIAVLTDQRLLLSRESRLLKFGEVQQALDLAKATRLEEVPLSHQSLAGSIKVAGDGKVLEFEYRAWAAEYGEPAMKSARFSSLLRRLLKTHSGSPWASAELEKKERRRESLSRHLVTGPSPETRNMDPVSFASWAADQLRAAQSAAHEEQESDD